MDRQCFAEPARCTCAGQLDQTSVFARARLRYIDKHPRQPTKSVMSQWLGPRLQFRAGVHHMAGGAAALPALPPPRLSLAAGPTRAAAGNHRSRLISFAVAWAAQKIRTSAAKSGCTGRENAGAAKAEQQGSWGVDRLLPAENKVGIMERSANGKFVGNGKNRVINATPQGRLLGTFRAKWEGGFSAKSQCCCCLLWLLLLLLLPSVAACLPMPQLPGC